MKISIIGVGNMGAAMIKGLVASGNDEVAGMNPSNPRVTALADELGFTLFNQYEDLVAYQPDVVIMTTPAPITVDMAKKLTGLDSKAVIISAAAGVTIAELKEVLPHNTIAAIIPNTPVAVNAGTIGLALEDDTDKDKIEHVLSQLGDIILVPEDKLGIVGVVGGCGPAFVDVFMDALSDASVKYSLNRQTAYQLIASMVKGSGALAYETKLSPAALRDQVTSPAGTTIRGVEALEKNGFRYAVIDAVNKAND
ncbi:MAG: pyrroline-5-carboxylate reductase [Limosilactobacillus sp.]|uniref:pyrroline-5-carboxylate reductase n=1 Tax=Limosilactobacillus sp. TaxID=2773925 RepID=UPI0026FEB488|nr:pyrroline-5-carboxylate reductase [Limosilactobacillus sp.]